MASKTTKITLQGIKRMQFSFCPFDRYKGTGDLRSIFNRVHNPTTRKSNPSCEIDMTVKHDNSAPQITVMYEDGDIRNYHPRIMSIDNILSDFNSLTRAKLDQKGGSH